jgi:rubrerythrin
MDKKLILIIIIIVCGLSISAYAISNTNADQKSNNTTNIINESQKNNTNVTNSNETREKKKSNEKYYCEQCDTYHSQPAEQYHRYGHCPICGKYVDTQTTSHTHDSGPGYEEEPR